MDEIETTAGNPLGYEKISRLILRFSVPAIASNVLNAVYNIVDQVFIGNSDIGYPGIAATTVTFPMFTIVAAMSIMLGVGSASSLNLNLGAGNKKEAAKTAGTGLSVMCLCGVVLAAVFLGFLTQFLYLFGATEDIIELSTDYAFIVVFGIPFQILTVGACYLIRGDGNPNRSMICMVSGAVFNLIFDPVFMFGFGWGIKGIALATALGQVLSAVLALSYIIRGMKTVNLTKKLLRPSFAITKKICALGLAGFSNQIAQALVNVVLNHVLRYYGDMSDYGSTVTLGVVGSISKINLIFLSTVVGVGHGCQPIYSYNYGAKNFTRVKETLKKALVCNIVIATAFFAVFQLFPKTIIGIFGSGDEMYFRFGERYLCIYLFMTFTNGLQPGASAYFSATGRAIMGAFVSMTRQILFLVPLLLILPYFFEIDGVVFAGPVADCAAATLAGVLFFREFRKLSRDISRIT